MFKSHFFVIFYEYANFRASALRIRGKRSNSWLSTGCVTSSGPALIDPSELKMNFLLAFAFGDRPGPLRVAATLQSPPILC